MFDLVIKGGTLVTATATYRADIGVNGERIAAIGWDLTGEQEVDATGKLVTPGAIDVHVHLQMPIGDGIRSSDDFCSGTRAAAYGGTTTIIDFVEPLPDEPLLEALAARRAEADEQVTIDYGLHMTLGPAEIDKLGQVPAAYAAGCASFKLYMAYGFRLNDGQLLRALDAVRRVGGLPVIHCENWDVICTLVERNLAAGHTSPHWHPRSRPAPLEGEAAGRAIDLAAFVGTPLYIFHVSCAQVVEQIVAARTQGLPIYGETCPQYLFLSDACYDQPGVLGALPVCSPPLRSPADQQALWTALARDHLQVVSTDHCPFLSEHKARGLNDYSRIPGGVPSIESRFSLIYSGGVQEGYLSPERWVDICCTTPARRFGLASKGHLAPGYDADLVVFDPQDEQILSTATLHEQVDWTPYDGLRVTGRPAMTVSRGEIIVAGGEFSGRPGRGRFIKRTIT